MPLAQLLRNTRKRSDTLNDLEEVYRATFGYAGDEPDIYADHDRCSELMSKMRRAIDALRVS